MRPGNLADFTIADCVEQPARAGHDDWLADHSRNRVRISLKFREQVRNPGIVKLHRYIARTTRKGVVVIVDDASTSDIELPYHQAGEIDRLAAIAAEVH